MEKESEQKCPVSSFCGLAAILVILIIRFSTKLDSIKYDGLKSNELDTNTLETTNTEIKFISDLIRIEKLKVSSYQVEPECKRQCPEKNNVILLSNQGKAGLSDRLSILFHMASIADFICADIQTVAPVYMLGKHEGAANLSPELWWSDFRNITHTNGAPILFKSLRVHS